MDKQTWFNLLFDYYGALLTEKQRHIMQLYFGEDLSLAEIAEQVGISRQGVHDQIKKAGKALENCETRLGHLQADRQQQQMLRQIAAVLSESIGQLRRGKAADEIAGPLAEQLEESMIQAAEQLAKLRNFPEG